MSPIAPPSFLNSLLLFLLSPRDRETVSGDLHEEFMEVKLPHLGPLRARLWYGRQVLSFVPGKLSAVFFAGPALTLCCCFTGLSGAWLGAMDLVLHHPASQFAIAAWIVSQALITLAALRFHRSIALRVAASAGSVALLYLAVGAWKATIEGAHPEGYVLLIALALILQTVLTLLTLPRPQLRDGSSA